MKKVCQQDNFYLNDKTEIKCDMVTLNTKSVSSHEYESTVQMKYKNLFLSCILGLKNFKFLKMNNRLQTK